MASLGEFKPKRAYEKADAAPAPIQKHTRPYAIDTPAEMYAKEPRARHSERNQAKHGDKHRGFCVAARPERLRQAKGKAPDEAREHAERDKKPLRDHRRFFRRPIEPYQPVGEYKQYNEHDKICRRAVNAEGFHIPFYFFVQLRAVRLTDKRDSNGGYGVSGQEDKSVERVCYGIGVQGSRAHL